MSTDIAVRQQGAVSLIQETARDLQAALQIGTALSNTIMVPAHFRGKPEECAAAILYGATIQMDPVTSLQQIHVISGKPGLYARAMVAIVLGHGHAIWTETAGPDKVIVAGKRKGSDQIERSEWTPERARKAGYFSNKKYETDPESMLYARASGDVARRVAPDALLGMAYSIEELELEEGSEPEQASARSSVSRLRSAVAGTPAIEAAPEPVEAEVVPEPVVDEPAQPKITTAQRKALGNLFDKHKMGREDALAYTASAIGRDVESSDQLTRDEAITVIKALAEIPDPPVEPTAEDIAALNAEAETLPVEDPPSGLFGAE